MLWACPVRMFSSEKMGQRGAIMHSRVAAGVLVPRQTTTWGAEAALTLRNIKPSVLKGFPNSSHLWNGAHEEHAESTLRSAYPART